MEPIQINHLAVLVAALSTFLLGGLWWSPVLFEKAWKEENRFTDEMLRQGNMAKIFGLAFVFSLIMSYNLAYFLGDPGIKAGTGALYGFFTGFGWVSMAIFIIGLFERKSWRYMLINGGYMVVAFTIMGLILGAWK
ncbi:MAG TPA: DUF1761 domain-containing protein [Saprospiraceae bacterium]|nr:DUF1761 domain-containing protein [Saprospiraceae bacterium]HNT19210.1 DUF1761 domain-containing protein [Saprospiraceae bacterium]